MREMDGGPAFPGPESHGDDHEGMSLRDYFAAKSLPGYIQHGYTPEGAAEKAYAVADAMIAERLK
jgi:hypothetical protein